ncbi:maltose alpha-D-glucosyltransferase [Tautonia sociabilis]|uniref:Maltokinase n=1 Tax=Tautonia sociabilis TaxID=2080755 RepID=A0A432MGL0_9BACT|nr:maltose alpha-D-glucosyltransferase [Tautonia sociabilis]RUL85926.1 maltose alpha-D-glucosyltransferase [Tautonia sociabilis]
MALTTGSDPLWYKDAIIYELHVRAFFDSNGDGIGDFPGLTEKLDYLQDLGVTALWLLPFYPSPLKDDGYDIAHYRSINPSYGTRRDFKVFVREAHRRGMRVINELVINHTSDQHPWFQAARLAPRGSKKRDFYVWSDTDEKYSDARIIFTDTEKSNWTWDPVAQQYYWHRFFSHQPDLNFDNPHVLRAVIRIMRFWFDLGVDGMRLDAIPYLIERDGTNCENLPETHAVLKQLRAALDENYRDKMFLAEANQWPDDVRPYFGDGDECHMAFHFPVMPRIFMAVRQEDRTPIVDIMERTPDIPESCQWAMFLRNHDELTLEMVTSEERDYMYNEYAADPQARINLGIRRRLAPLVNYSRRRLELLNSLLLSFPGTPVLYYGDEIGMGDNIYLGDRNGVRTPMQWTGDRNAGFSKADFARLYSAPIMDPITGYQAINVEAQQRDPSSLLNWMKRMIALRKRYRAFGRGTMEFLKPTNRKVLAYVRRYKDDIILCVANLSRFVQPCELDLSTFQGMRPVEMLGNTEFPRIGELPYFITLGPHAFYWFTLHRTDEATILDLGPSEVEGQTYPVIELEEGWHSLLRGAARRRMQTEIIPAFLRRQRWFAGKARKIRSVEILDATQPRGLPERSALLTVEVRYEDGRPETYVLPIALALGPGGEDLISNVPKLIMARARIPGGDGVLHDAVADDGFCLALLDAVRSRREFSTGAGRYRAEPTSALTEILGRMDVDLMPRRGSGEQSNTSIIFGQRLIMKLFRRVEPGLNPELEIGRALTEKTDFEHFPKLAGSIEYRRPDTEPTAVAVFQELVSYQAVGWEHALDELSRYYELVLSRPELEPLPVAVGSPLALIHGDVPEVARDTIGAYLSSAATLGRRTAELHAALAGISGDPAFAPEPIGPDDLKELSAEIRLQIDSALDLLRKRLDDLPDDVTALARRVLDSSAALTEPIDALPGSRIDAPKIRVHGDFHLGQVLWSRNDYILLDFEGEPAKSLAQRRAKHSPVKDVVGMLRSFSYAAFDSLFRAAQDRDTDYERLLPWALAWESWTSAAFLASYLEVAGPAGIVPDDRDQLATLLRCYTLDKALYELQYELNNRPSWVRIPLSAVALLAERAAPAEGNRP